MILVHEHLIGRFEVKNPPKEGEGAYLELWMKRLIETIGMELLSGPHLSYVSDPGNRGWTGVAIIKTSHIAIHIWEEPNPALIQLDCYSCAPLDPARVLEAMTEFDPISYHWSFLDRANALVPVQGGVFFPAETSSRGSGTHG